MGGLTVSSQTFLTAELLQGSLVDTPVSGLMGLAFPALSGTNSVPFWLALTNNSQLSSPEFSIWLGRDLNPVNETVLAPGGAFTLGGTNSSLFSGDIQFSDLALTQGVASFWQVALTSLAINSSQVTLSTANPLAAIDTGTTLIGGPHADIVSFYNSIPGLSSVKENDSGMFEIPCDTSISVSMAFGGKSWAINPVDFIIPTNNNDVCLGALFDLSQGSSISPNDGSPSWVVGDTFLKNVYTVFRSSPASVGFAQLSTAAGGTGTSAGTAPSTATSSASSTSGAVISTAVPALLTLTTAFTALIMLCL
jgi:cathepsin D